MENIIFNELIGRGYLVDVGVVETFSLGTEGKQQKKQLEVDFVINKGPKKLYIQSSLSMESEEKKRQELKPLYTIKDNFKKIFITKTHAKPWTDDDGDSSCRSLSIPVGSQHTQLKDFLTQILSRA